MPDQLTELCQGSFEDALALVEKTAAEARDGHTKSADGVLDALKGYAGQAGDYVAGQWAKAKPSLQGYLDSAKPHLDTAGTWLGDQMKDPGRAAMLGAGTGAGLGLLGSTVFGEPSLRNMGYGSLLGGLMGGAAGGGYGLLNGFGKRVTDQVPSEGLAGAEKNLADASAAEESLKRVTPFTGKANPNKPKPPIPWGAMGGEALDQVLDTGVGVTAPFGFGDASDQSRTRVVDGVEQPNGFLGSATHHALSTAALDTAGNLHRRALPTNADILKGLKANPDYLGKGWAYSDLSRRDDLGQRVRVNQSFPEVQGVEEIKPQYSKATANATRRTVDPVTGRVTVTNIPGQPSQLLDPGKPGVPGRDELHWKTLQRAGQEGQALRGGVGDRLGGKRFAGTALPRIIAYPGAALTHYFLSRLPAAHGQAVQNQADAAAQVQHWQNVANGQQ